MSEFEPPFVSTEPDELLSAFGYNIKTESNNTDFKCEICAKSFSKAAYLRKHVLGVHENLVPFQCEECDCSFKTKRSLQFHVDGVHRSLRPFRCEVCLKEFYVRKNLLQHITAIHKGERPYVCSYCSKAFKSKYYVKKHIGRLHKDQMEEEEPHVNATSIVDSASVTPIRIRKRNRDLPKNPRRTQIRDSTKKSRLKGGGDKEKK
ncbi:hypothetical protein ACTXT7_005566 [Hymenolepis weldensis]